MTEEKMNKEKHVAIRIAKWLYDFNRELDGIPETIRKMDRQITELIEN